MNTTNSSGDADEVQRITCNATGKPLNSFCLACFNGDYPLPVDPALDKFIMERREQRAKALADQEAQPTLFTDLK